MLADLRSRCSHWIHSRLFPGLVFRSLYRLTCGKTLDTDNYRLTGPGFDGGVCEFFTRQSACLAADWALIGILCEYCYVDDAVGRCR